MTQAASKQRRVQVLVGSYLPGYKAGGPIRSIQNMVALLGEEYDFKIATLDRDLGDTQAFADVPTHRWVPVGQAQVMYLEPGLMGLVHMWALLRAVDGNTVLYLNSFFNRRFSILAVLMRRLGLCKPLCLLLAPRGEFSAGALAFKPTRKRLYIRVSRWLGLYDNALWQASSEFEATDILRQFPATVDIAVAGVVSQQQTANSVIVTASDIGGPVPGGLGTRKIKVPGQLRLVFVGRCSRMKNLSGALTMLAGVAGDVSFRIYGPAEDAEYWRECQSLIAALPPNIKVHYEGQIQHDKVADVFAAHDLLLLPTLGENFGHVISEALGAGCPVLISDQTPWRNLEAAGAGWDIPLRYVDRFRAVLQQCVDADHDWFTVLSRRARYYAIARAGDPRIIEANRDLLNRAFAWRDRGGAANDL